jgi:aryl-alcohol dehydrogenase-like predicted oxidoreductase
MSPGQEFSDGDHRANNPYFTDHGISKTNAFLKKIRPLAEDKGASLAQLVLRWTLEQPGITIALAGARNQKQSVQNAEAAGLKLTASEVDFINSELANLGRVKA